MVESVIYHLEDWWFDPRLLLFRVTNQSNMPGFGSWEKFLSSQTEPTQAHRQHADSTKRSQPTGRFKHQFVVVWSDSSKFQILFLDSSIFQILFNNWGGSGISLGCLLEASKARCFGHVLPVSRPRTCWRDHISQLRGEVAGVREIWASVFIWLIPWLKAG